MAQLSKKMAVGVAPFQSYTYDLSNAQVLCVFLSFFRSEAELHYFLWNNGLSYGTIQEGRKSDTVFFFNSKVRCVLGKLSGLHLSEIWGVFLFLFWCVRNDVVSEGRSKSTTVYLWEKKITKKSFWSYENVKSTLSLCPMCAHFYTHVCMRVRIPFALSFSFFFFYFPAPLNLHAYLPSYSLSIHLNIYSVKSLSIYPSIYPHLLSTSIYNAIQLP